MTGHIREERLALYASGDVAGRERATIAAHIECCGGCATVLEEFRQSQSFVGAALQDPEREDLLHVRAGLAAKLQRSPARTERGCGGWPERLLLLWRCCCQRFT